MKQCAPLYVVGLGPGSHDLLAPRARTVLENAECVGGYSLYLKLLPEELLAGKTIVESGMRQERERCQKILQCSLSGRSSVLVCSGDSGIYALASLVIEIVEEMGMIGNVPLEIVPGIPALCAGAALLGAPLTHDFACISLSDLLTPFELIEKRLRAALGADFVCVIYNPRSRGRQDYLQMAIDIAREFRSADCPVGLVKNAARSDEKVITARLADFDPHMADMLSIVFIGNSETRLAGPYMLTPRGYAKKEKAYKKVTTYV